MRFVASFRSSRDLVPVGLQTLSLPRHFSLIELARSPFERRCLRATQLFGFLVRDDAFFLEPRSQLGRVLCRDAGLILGLDHTQARLLRLAGRAPRSS